MAYGCDPARVGSQGGFSGFSTGFNGRIQMVALYHCSFTRWKIQLRANAPIGSFADQRRRHAASGLVPPLAGDSNKRAIVIAVAC